LEYPNAFNVSRILLSTEGVSPRRREGLGKHTEIGGLVNCIYLYEY